MTEFMIKRNDHWSGIDFTITDEYHHAVYTIDSVELRHLAYTIDGFCDLYNRRWEEPEDDGEYQTRRSDRTFIRENGAWRHLGEDPERALPWQQFSRYNLDEHDIPLTQIERNTDA